jgi:hypothetical protein
MNGRTFSSYALRVNDQGCFGGSPAGGCLFVEEISSVLRATKSLYRLSTVHVRIGVETGSQFLPPGRHRREEVPA